VIRCMPRLADSGRRAGASGDSPRMKEGFHFAEPSPKPAGGKDYPWWRVAHKHPAGQETVLLDFLMPGKAQALAFVRNAQEFEREPN
jgi:hypothetical protein